MAKKKAEMQRQKDLDKLKQQRMEESANMEAEEEKKRKKAESEMVRILSNLTSADAFCNCEAYCFFPSPNYLFLFNREKKTDARGDGRGETKEAAQGGGRGPKKIY